MPEDRSDGLQYSALDRRAIEELYMRLGVDPYAHAPFLFADHPVGKVIQGEVIQDLPGEIEAGA